MPPRAAPSPRATRRTPARAILAVALAAMLASTGCLQFLTGAGVRSTWAYEMTGVDALRSEGLTGAGVRVAVVDTGIDASHPALRGVPIRWIDVVNERGTPYDDHGHGTHVAGLVAAQPGTGAAGLAGGAPGVELLVAKAIDAEGRGTDADVARAIRWAADEGADVISLSLGGQPGVLNLGSQTQDAASDAVSRGVVVVAAAGNQGGDSNDVATPANVRGVVAVGAVNQHRQVADFSNRGAACDQPALCDTGVMPRQDPHKKPELVAPGVAVASTVPTGACTLCTSSGVGAVSGTSQAVPFVTAAVALALEDRPEWQRDGADGGSASAVEHVKRALMRSASKVPGQASPHDDRAGYGLVQAVGFRDRL